MIPLISFIVPVYNAKATLERCTSSLLSQNIGNESFEIILVNDGSTDGSGELCKDLSKRMGKVTLISQMNLGRSEARNSGVRAACGEYLCFVDSDDILITGGIGSLLPYCDGNNDLIRFWCELNYPEKKGDVDMGDGRVTFNGSGQEYLRRYGLETFCWNYLYKRSFIEKNNLRFPPGIIGEDFSFMFDVMMANPHIISVAKRLYRYNIHPNSISTIRSPEQSRRWVKDLTGSMSRIAEELEPMRNSDPTLFKSCRRSLEGKMSALFSRILSANYSIREYREVIDTCRTTDLLPLQIRSNTVVSFLAQFPFLYPIASSLYRRVFLPNVYPRLDRNG